VKRYPTALPGTLLTSPFILLSCLCLVIVSGAGCRPSQLTYAVHDGPESISVSGRYETVAEVVAAAGLSLEPGDVVSPTAGTPADPSSSITIDRASEVTVIGLESVTIYRTQQETLGGFLEEVDLIVPPGSRLLADGHPVNAEMVHVEPLPAHVIFDPYKRVIITDGEERWALRTTTETVGAALLESGVTLGALDTVTPSRETALSADMEIAIERAASYVISGDGQTVEVYSDSTAVLDILADNGIALGPLDYTRPAAESTIDPGDTIEIVRVTERIDVEEAPIPFESVYEPSAEMEIDTLAEASLGSNGVLQRRTRVRLENGAEVSRTPDGEIVTVAPVNRVVRYGTNIVMRTIDTPEGPVEYWRKVTMYASSYTATSAGKNPGEPGYGVTASGVQAGTGVVAVDRSVVPFRSYVYVPGYGVAFVGDTGGGIKGRMIDLGYDEDEYQSWHQYVEVYFLGPPPPAEDIRWILP
jgi:uncharacterized protein YabE (DUF348 family)